MLGQNIFCAMIASLTVGFILLTCVIQDSTEVQNVRLILPPIVQAGTSATLLCLYDLEEASLYSVQWYRGQFEFFRYVPDENPPTKVFPIPGLYVDILASNESQVTLTNIPVQISGEFSCEVTTDAPPFSASCTSENLTVVAFNLELSVPKTRYGFGELLAADCTVTPRMDFIKLIFHWNNRPIAEKFISNTSESTFLFLNTSVINRNRQFPTTGELKCSAIMDKSFHILSKSVMIKLEPKFPFKSTAIKLKLNFVSVVPLLAKLLIIK